MSTLWRLAAYLRPHAGRLALGSLLLGVGGAMMAIVVSTLKPLVNHVLFLTSEAPTATGVSGAPGPLDFERWLPVDSIGAAPREQALVWIPLLLVAVFFVRGVFLYFGQYLTIRSGAHVIRDLRLRLYESVAYQSLAFFQTHPTGLIVSRILNDVQRIQRFCTTGLAELVRVGAMVPFLLAVAIYHDWRMSLVMIVALPLLGYPTLRLGKRLRRASTASQETMALMATRLSESVSGVKIVQGFGMERFEVERFRDVTSRMLRADLKAGRAQSLSPAVMELIGAMIGAALFYLAGLGIARGRLDPGDFTVVLFCLGMLFTSFRRLSALYADSQHALAASVRVFEILDLERTIRDLPDAKPLPTIESSVRFDGVRFSYGDDEVLAGVDITIHKGETIALVGRSGSGKSTLANLLSRFYDPSAGRVLIDGKDIREVTIESLRGQMGIVTQESILFDDTVRDNIAYGRPDVSHERVAEAARAANADEFIVELPQGYDTRLGERGTRLSGGQRQRIAIARALLKSPPILILDEATSALDSESEGLVQQALETLMRGRTSLVIAHRLATVRSADRILVMERGLIVEQGSHDDLLARAGVYARLYEMQFREPENSEGRRGTDLKSVPYDLLWLGVGAAILFTAALGARDLWNPNEPTYGQAVVEMAERGDWLVPTVGGETFGEKPILYFWLARVASVMTGGVGEFALRLPSALAGVIGTLLTYLLTLPYASRLRARLAGALFATTYIVFWSARSIQMDLLLTIAIWAAVLAVTRVVDFDLDPWRGWSLAGLFAALGFLAKGPVGLIVPGIVVVSYLLTTGRARALWTPAPAGAAIVCAAVSLPWLVALWVSGESEFIHELLVRQNLTRFVQPWDHVAPWWYYLREFWTDMAPWSFFVPLSIAVAGRSPAERRLDRLCQVAIVGVVLFFSLSASKRSPYILPVAPAAAILVSGVAERWIRGTLERRRVLAGKLILGLFGGVFVAVGVLVLVAGLARYPAAAAAGRAVALLLIAGGLAGWIGIAVSRRFPRGALVPLPATVVALYLLAALWLLPVLDVYKSPRAFGDRLVAEVGPEEPLTAYRIWKWRAGYTYYSGRRISRVTTPAALEEFWKSTERVFVIVERGMLEEFRNVVGPIEPLVSETIGSNEAYLFANR